MLAVVRDKDTKQMRVMWDTDDVPEGSGEPGIGPNDELVHLSNMTHKGVLAEARSKVGGPELGILRVHDNSIEVESRPPKPTIAGQIRANRTAKGAPMNAPVTLDEIEAAERTINGS